MVNFFIGRWRFSSVVAPIFVLAGVRAFLLPIAQHPDITPPQVVTASYPGASADIAAKTVTTPIEEQANGVQGIEYTSSVSANDGSATITLSVGCNLDIAVVVENVERQLETGKAPLEAAKVAMAEVTGPIVATTAVLVAVFAGLAAACALLFVRLPTAFVPSEDQGYLIVNVAAPDGSALGRTGAVVNRVRDQLKAVPGLRDVIAISGCNLITGASQPSAGIVFAVLQPWGNAKRPS